MCDEHSLKDMEDHLRATGADIHVVLCAFRELWQLRNHPALLDGLDPPA